MAEALREFEKYDFFERTDYEEPLLFNHQYQRVCINPIKKYFYSLASIFSYVIIFIDYTTLRAASWPI